MESNYYTYGLVEAEEEERLKVVVADAVPNPWTMVIHLGHTNVADTAVVCALRFPVATGLTVHFLVGWWRLRYYFGSFECCHAIGEERHENESVEENFDEFAVDFVGHPLIDLIIHQVDRHRVEEDDDESHDEDEDARDHVVSEDATEQAVAEHAHGARLKSFIIIIGIFTK